MRKKEVLDIEVQQKMAEFARLHRDSDTDALGYQTL